MSGAWTAEEAAGDLVAVDQALAELPAATAEERLRRVADYFAGRYGPARGQRVLGCFLRLCLYVEHHGAELRARGLVDEAGHRLDGGFLAALLAALDDEAPDAAGGERPAGGATVAAVPARDVPDDAVEP